MSLSVERGEIHGLLGENGAGKSTLMNVVYGLLRPDAGRIEIDGAAVDVKSPRDALALGIGMVHQDFRLVPDMTVAENVAIGLAGGRLRRSRLAGVSARIVALSERHGLALRPDDVIAGLSVGARQRVEIIKLLHRGADLLILDEPTAALTPPEWEHLAAVLRSLAERGKAIVLITHKLDELLGVASRCTVLRDGRVVGEARMAETSKAELARMMVGRPVALRTANRRREPGATVLRATGLALAGAGSGVPLIDIDLAVHEREILAVAGVDGNGQRELVEVLSGMRAPTAGAITVGEVRRARLTPREFRAAGGAVVPESRDGMGLALDLSVAENLVTKDIAAAPFAHRGLLRRRAIREHARRLVAEHDVRCPSVGAPVRVLSGGHRQRLLLARELRHGPRALIAAQPTRGLDVGAIEAVHRRLLDYRDGGGGILLLSIELDEVLALADRIAVMVAGRLVATIDVGDADAALLGLLLAGEDVPAAPAAAAR